MEDKMEEESKIEEELEEEEDLMVKESSEKIEEPIETKER